jgi:hypothetical protein
MFSVALSLGSRPPDVIRHRLSTEPGLSSPATFRSLRERPSGRLTKQGWGRPPPTSRGEGGEALEGAHARRNIPRAAAMGKKIL